jgi:hypothetical protein
MKLNEVLEKYDSALLDQISSDKVDEAILLRLPKSITIQEIISALSSLSYISNKITYAKPPTFAILNLILSSPENIVEIEGFRDKVLSYVKDLCNKADSLKDFLNDKNFELYIKVLNRTWENDGYIDKSESFILELLRVELGIWDSEHFILAHHSTILKLWDIGAEYYSVRNSLLSTGILLTEDNKYLIADEVAIQIRRAFGMEIKEDSFKRLLGSFTKEDLAAALGNFGLFTSGAKDELVDRIINALIPPTELLNTFPLETLRVFCRQNDIQISGSKNTVINNIIQFFGQNRDLTTEIAEEPPNYLPITPEARELEKELFTKILFNSTNQQLYDALYQSYLTTSGTKEEKVSRLVESPWSERSILNRLRKEDLSLLCKKLELNISGAKQELVDRILDISFIPASKIEEKVVTQEIKEEPKSIIKDHDMVDNIKEAATIPLPLSFAEIDKAFIELDHDEKIVLSLIKDAKSLTELEIERAVIKHKLGWFLLKAHMAEMMAKLKRSKQNTIEIKSVRNTNIYQWIEDNKRNEIIIEKKSARDIIDALRHGVVPKNNLDLLAVGQLSARKHLSEILKEVNQNKSHFKFIRGQYGSGKTFLCSWLKEYALENEFAVSSLNISHDQPLSDLPVFFSGMINSLRTPEKRDSSALVDILESWLLNIHKKTAQIEGLPAFDLKTQNKLISIVEKRVDSELSNLNDIEPGFAPALKTFYKAKFEGNQMWVANSIAWITGSRALSGQALREIGVKGYLEANNVFPRMRALLQILSGAKYNGLLLLVDELELVRKFPHIRQREQALETLRLLIDESGKNALPGCLIIFTGTDEFFDDERFGLKSYAALAERVLAPLKHESHVSMRQPIISLESLDKERLSNVIFKIRDLYGIAYDWDSKKYVDETSVIKLIDNWTTFGDENISRKPRPILREFIQILDLCEENKGLSIEEFLKKKEFPTASVN